VVAWGGWKLREITEESKKDTGKTFQARRGNTLISIRLNNHR